MELVWEVLGLIVKGLFASAVVLAVIHKVFGPKPPKKLTAAEVRLREADRLIAELAARYADQPPTMTDAQLLQAIERWAAAGAPDENP